MPKILEYYLQISHSLWLIGVCTRHCSRTLSVICTNSGKAIQNIIIFLKRRIIQSNYTLQNWVYSKKHFAYSGEVFKSISNILKSPKKEEKAVSKHSLHLLYSIFSGLFSFYSTQIQSTYDIS
ncbi:MAG TPA: hypothetical protein DCG75_01945 [Bacteroidales bacterium]|nr:hypothetical protein [Bacteroidales bacterium]